MSVHNYIAYFLKENGYHQTLEAFRNEHNAPLDTELVNRGEIDTLLIDKLKQLSTSKDKDLNTANDADSPWIVKQPQLNAWTHLDLSNSLKFPPIDGLVIDCAISRDGLGVFATATRKLIVANLNTGEILLNHKNHFGNSVIRKVEFVGEYIILGGINGLVHTVRFKHESSELNLVDSVQAHERLIIDMKIVKLGDQTLVVTLGWDKYIQVFKLNGDGKLESFLERILISGVGSCIEAISHESKLFIVVGLKESSLLDVVTIEPGLCLKFKVAMSDVEYSSIRSIPMCISGAVLPGIGPVIAVATSHEPFMRTILLSLASLAQENSESIQRSCILANFNTMSPQDKYSEAKICFRANGEGIWVLGDDGIIRGLELNSGKIVQEISAHDGRIKAMALLKDSILTCGIDREIKFWRRN